MLVEQTWQVSPTLDPDLFVRARQVSADGVPTDPEGIADLTVLQTRGGELECLRLALRELVRRADLLDGREKLAGKRGGHTSPASVLRNPGRLG
jgi:hypothetical protein